MHRRRVTFALLAAALAAPAALAGANTSHAGWPKIDGLTVINRSDADRTITGLPDKHNELLGGNGDDTLVGGAIGDVLWGYYKPAGQPTTQTDTITGGAGKDFIYAGHGRNLIFGGGGADQIHAHFGRGEIHCASAKAVVFLSHRSRPDYKLFGCSTISYKTAGS